jgi:hypothetical protein
LTKGEKNLAETSAEDATRKSSQYADVIQEEQENVA